MKTSCNLALSSLSSCFVTHGWIIAIAGFAAWMATYTVMRSRENRHRQMCEKAAPAPVRGWAAPAAAAAVTLDGAADAAAAAAATAAAATASYWVQGTGTSTGCVLDPTSGADAAGTAAAAKPIAAGHQAPPASPKVQREAVAVVALGRQPQATHAAAVPGRGALALCTAQSGGHSGTGSRTSPTYHATTTHSSLQSAPSPIPLETFGVYALRRFGLAPAIWRLEEYANLLADSVDDGMMVRMLCIPVTVYSVVFALLVRMRITVSAHWVWRWLATIVRVISGLT